jgi:DNA excision repair protein ERCC-2
MMSPAMQVDLEHKLITIGVGELVTPPQARVRGIGGFGALRAELGRRAHEGYRGEHEGDDDRSSELSVALTCQIDGYEARVRGRIDGVAWHEDRAIVEELKSVMLTSAELAASKAEDFAEARLQARLYALCLDESGRASEVEAQVVLMSLVDGMRRTISADYERARTAAELDDLLRVALERAHQAERRAKRRRALAERLVFPFVEPRPHQLELSEIIATALAAGQPVLATAPTGIGKTISALLPALRYGLENDRPVLFATAKGTQQRLAASTFEALARKADLEPGSLTAMTLRSKERMCPEGSLQCHPERCPFLTDYDRREAEAAVVDQLRQPALHIDSDRIYGLGEELMLCPYELSMQLVAQVDLIIGDYNYAFHPAVSLGTGPVDDRAGGAVVVVDEAHNLFDRAREYYSPSLADRSVVAVSRALCGAPLSDPRLDQDLLALCDTVRGAISDVLRVADDGERGFVEGRTPYALCASDWIELASRAGELQLRYGHHNWRRAHIEPADPVMQLLEEIGTLGALVGSEEPEMVGFVANQDARGGKGVGVICVDPARRLARCHQAAVGTVAMSATLTPLSYYAEVLGFGALDPVMTSAPSPFPSEHRRAVVVPTVATTYRERDSYAEQIASLIGQVVAVQPGRYVAYFSSFAYLAKVRPLLSVPADQVLVQMPAMPLPTRDKLLERFRLSQGPMLLLAVTGGVFSEGVDLPGDELIGSIVVGPSLPAVGFERQLMQRHYDDRDESGFRYAMVYPGMQRVIQAAGRVIRSPDDRGVVVLLGRRFAQSPYADCLPEDWYRFAPTELVTEDPIGALADFWSSFD